jgi:hypothetical protein
MIKKKHISKYRRRERGKPLIPEVISINEITTMNLGASWYLDDNYEGKFDAMRINKYESKLLGLTSFAPEPVGDELVVIEKVIKEIRMGVGEI